MQGYTEKTVFDNRIKCDSCGKNLEYGMKYPVTVDVHGSKLFGNLIMEADYGYLHRSCWQERKHKLEKFDVNTAYITEEELRSYGVR